MQTSPTVKEIASALAAAQAEFKAVAKSGQNEQQGYGFADLEDYFRVVRAVLAKHGLSLTSSVEEITELPTRPTAKGGTLYAVRVRAVTRLLHSSGEWLEASAYGEGQDAGDKAPYKAITGARKYGLASLLGLATSDDPERDEGENGNGTQTPRAGEGPARPYQAPQRSPGASTDPGGHQDHHSGQKADPGSPGAAGQPKNGSGPGSGPSASTAQLAMLEKLASDQALPATWRDRIRSRLGAGVSRKQASTIIGSAKAALDRARQGQATGAAHA